MNAEETTLIEAIGMWAEAHTHIRGDQMAKDGYRYPSAHGFVLEHGRFFDIEPYDHDRFGEYAEMCEPKKCFANSLAMSKFIPNMTYVEGYAWVAGLPIEFHHGWLVDDVTGRAIDLTWRPGTAAGPGAAYFGVPFTSAFCVYHVQQVFEAGHGNVSVLDQWERRHPILRMPEEKVRKIIHPGGESWRKREAAHVSSTSRAWGALSRAGLTG